MVGAEFTFSAHPPLRFGTETCAPLLIFDDWHAAKGRRLLHERITP